MINLSNVHYQYGSGESIFEQLHLQLDEGKVYGLLGRNGVGKSTLLKLITGGLKPSTGTIQLGDHTPFDRDPEMYRDIFYLPEEIPLSELSVSSYLNAFSRFYPKFESNKFEAICAQLEVNKKKKIRHLSHGQIKKFHIAFGLACNTKYIFLDEPTNGLDIPSKSQFRKVLASQINDDQIIVISTHQIKDLTNLIESVIILENGQILISKDLYEIENRIQFQYSLHETTESASVYAERTTGGFVHILPNEDNEPTELDLEILFNGVLHKRDEMLTLINSSK